MKTLKEAVISPFHGKHDHESCQASALQEALLQCERKGLKLTPLRRQVLEIVWQSHNPIGAYDVLAQLQEIGHKPAPPTAYRALDFLVEAKLIHRIESLNAFIGCPTPQTKHQSQFLICRNCGHTAELSSDSVNSTIKDHAKSLGFIVDEAIIEIHGICENCH